MLKFKYKIESREKEGFIFAKNKKQALQLLVRQGIQPSDLVLIAKGVEKDPAESVKKLNSKIALPFLKRIFQLHGAGLPIGDTLKILQTRLRDQNQKELAVVLWKDLSEGKSLGDALKNYPNVFGEDIIYPIEAAEVTGNLAPVFKEIIHLLTEREQLKKKVLSGMTYPTIVSIVAIIVVGFFLFFLLPRIEHMLTSLGGEMALPARILIGFSHALLYGFPVIIVGLVVSYIAIRSWRKFSASGKFKTDNFVLKLPIVSTLIRYVEICRVSNLLSTLLSSGVNLTEGMRLTEKVIGNSCLRKLYQEARNKINDGVAMSVAFKAKNVPFFTDLALDILTVGESTGNMHESLKEVYRLHNEELDAKFRFLTHAITSSALGFAFFLVGVLALGIVSSVMQFSSSLNL
ncbi:MAG: type II secretion system F family protein [Puniceicoccales bacterium]|jgi:type II secretory pathway component PulF|nr:type II secretion system F family protein [Puniceicoccales bacterium]